MQKGKWDQPAKYVFKKINLYVIFKKLVLSNFCYLFPSRCSNYLVQYQSISLYYLDGWKKRLENCCQKLLNKLWRLYKSTRVFTQFKSCKQQVISRDIKRHLPLQFNLCILSYIIKTCFRLLKSSERNWRMTQFQ